MPFNLEEVELFTYLGSIINQQGDNESVRDIRIQGDVVCNTLPNSPERLLTDLGIILAGAVATNGMVALSDGADFVGSIQRGGCVTVIVDPKQKLNQPLTVLERRLRSRVGHTVDCAGSGHTSLYKNGSS
nr:hypothetical protein BaRGS_009239 [Batillaria attramentaria]